MFSATWFAHSEMSGSAPNAWLSEQLALANSATQQRSNGGDARRHFLWNAFRVQQERRSVGACEEVSSAGNGVSDRKAFDRRSGTRSRARVTPTSAR